MMNRRYLQIGRWVSSVDDWTLCECKLSAPSYRKNSITVPGLDGELDLSDALTGTVSYSSRTLTARLELSAGTRMAREALIDDLVNQFDGTVQQMILPDDPQHSLTGRVQIAKQYNDNAHACIKITAVCDPWRYRLTEHAYRIAVSGEKQAVTVRNGGRKRITPVFIVYGVTESNPLTVRTLPDALSSHEITTDDTYSYPDILYEPGDNTLYFSGQCSVTIRFREAVL